MTKLHIAVGLGVFALLSAGCASNQMSSRSDSATELKMAAIVGDDARTASNLGQVASIWGDAHTSALLFQRATDADPSPLNKFNLATARQNEGRTFDALTLYDQVAKEGKTTFATTLPPGANRQARNVRFNLATVAGERSAGILDEIRRMPTAATESGEITEMTPADAARLDDVENPL